MARSQEIAEPVFQTRAYQLEMFNHSLETNTIVVMGTGTGKTHIASLRIDAELTRKPSKYVWFTAPNACLVDQQYQFLASQLPEYNIRSLTGQDNVDMWKTRTWRTVLEGVNVVVATPQVLFDALHNAHVQLKRISLLIFDEAHHCQAKDPSALIMQNFYHPQKRLTGTQDLPHILGLTASPQISEKSASVAQLEQNLDAVCRSPTISIDQYAQHLQKPVVVKRLFTAVSRDYSKLLRSLEHIVRATNMYDDPYYGELQLKAQEHGDDGERARQKLKKFEKNGQTPAIKEVSKLLGNAEHLHERLGTWASDFYVTTCVSNWRGNALDVNEYHGSYTSRHREFIDNVLRPLDNVDKPTTIPCDEQVSAKALSLIDFLLSAYHTDIAVIVFVERRAAAWALCQLLQAIPTLTCYGTFSYVGSSSSKVGTLHEAYATKKQDLEFMGFRQGLRNLCIATSVAEEGLDVQAVNVVVRFDDPKQLVSYVQSRGRARCKDSQIVHFEDSNGAPARYDHWIAFEKELEKLYYQQEREKLQRQEFENIVEDSNKSYRIESTGALLDLNVSVSRLAHFCAKQPIPSDPVYILDGEPGVAISVKVLLPSTVPPPLRTAISCRTWKSENMAKRDAAFHAMKALHIAGLIDDHLVPFEVENTSEPLLHEKRMMQIPPEQQVWLESSSGEMRPYRVEIKHEQTRYLSLILMLQSTPLQQRLCFPLTESSGRNLDVSIVPLGSEYVSDISNTGDVTQFLFEAAFQLGSALSSLKDPCRLSCILVPEFVDTQLSRERVRLQDFLRDHEWLRHLQPMLIWKKTRPRPYIWYPPHVIKRNIEGEPILVAKQVRKLQIFARSLNVTVARETLPLDKELLIEDCELRGVASVYGPIVLLLPTILHYVAAATRAQHANQTVLRSIELSNMDCLVPALIAKSASGTYNYERLEFLGDACLKFLASVQMFFNHPLATEGILTRRTHEIIGNTRLERATLDVGLAPFITTEIPAQKHWKLPSIREDPEMLGSRNVLLKTLADVIESVLGAAFLEGMKSGQAISRCIAALQLFIPEVPWQTSEEHIKTTSIHMKEVTELSLLQQRIKDMTGCEIRNSELLAEGLTHSTDIATQPALDRLEFLGDAILDQIVKVKLFRYGSLDAGRLTVCRHALVSHAFLAYLTLGIHCNQVVRDIRTGKAGSSHLVTSAKEINLTDLVKFREASMREPIAASKAKYDNIRDYIKSELKGRFPWTLLRSLKAPKVCSDVMESLLAVLYLDAGGSLTPCEELLDRLGLMDLLEQMAMNAEFEVRTPGTILRELCEEHKVAVSIKARCEQSQEVRQYIGEVRLGGSEGEISITRSASCLEEAKSVVAEAARDFLLLLQQPKHEATEHDSSGIEMDIDTDIVVS